MDAGTIYRRARLSGLDPRAAMAHVARVLGVDIRAARAAVAATVKVARDV